MSNGTGLVANLPSAPGQQTPCTQGGPELLPGAISAAASAAIDLDVLLCNGAGDVRIDIDGTQVVGQPNTQHVKFRLPPLNPGSHVLLWSVQTNAPNWQTRDEVSVNDVTVFRRRKRNDGTNPVNLGFLFIQVS
jgi:hypothetical protein